MEKATNEELVAGLRSLADFYETHQDMPLPTFAWFDNSNFWDRDQFVGAVRMLADGGMVHKKSDTDKNILNQHHAFRMFGPIKVELTISKSVICTKVRKLMMVDTYECPDSLLTEDMT